MNVVLRLDFIDKISHCSFSFSKVAYHFRSTRNHEICGMAVFQTLYHQPTTTVRIERLFRRYRDRLFDGRHANYFAKTHCTDRSLNIMHSIFVFYISQWRTKRFCTFYKHYFRSRKFLLAKICFGQFAKFYGRKMQLFRKLFPSRKLLLAKAPTTLHALTLTPFRGVVKRQRHLFDSLSYDSSIPYQVLFIEH